MYNKKLTIKEKIDNQTFELCFYMFDKTFDTEYWTIYMSLYSKRKHMDQNENEHKLTGKNPIKTIVVAKNCFEQLHNELLERTYGLPIVMIVNWIDNRRRDVYYKFLRKYGYDFANFDGQKCLMRRYELNEH